MPGRRQAHGSWPGALHKSDLTEDDGSPSDGFETVTAEADTNSDEQLSQEELEALTVAKLKTLARENGITLTATTKAEIIQEILTALAENQEDNEGQEGGGA